MQIRGARSIQYALIILAFVLFSCEKNDEETALPSGSYAPGVVLSLDDDYVDNWAAAHELLKEYNWKATFFVTKFNQLSADKIAKLQAFKNYGHEIAGHGLNHLKATEFVSLNGANAYLNQEIYPMMDLMDANGLHATSFAYPYGARNGTTDNLLLNDYRILRGTAYGQPEPKYHSCYYIGKRVVWGLGIDNSYAHFSIPYFMSLLEYAKNNNKIVIFYAHKPVETSHGDYETEYQTLIQLCRYVKANNLKFYTMSDLYNL